jgi:phospholipase C
MSSTIPNAIKHIVVLMLENRSFDHMLGHLAGLDGTQHSNFDPGPDPNGPHVDDPVHVTFDATPISPAVGKDGDEPHDFESVNIQLFGVKNPPPDAPITCSGFIEAARRDGEAYGIEREVMRCFKTEESLEAMTALAKHFVMCDAWFSAVPGPTWPNRLFTHAAQSFGHANNHTALYDGTQTIFKRLQDKGIDWAVYYHDIPQAACFNYIRGCKDSKHRKCFRHISEFYRDAASSGSFPQYVFIEPAYFEPGKTFWGHLLDRFKEFARKLGLPIRPSIAAPNDQHAPHDVRWGEILIADVYDTLRSQKKLWEQTLLIVLHDEHGGLYEHTHPPSLKYGLDESTSPKGFRFDRLGVRVPAFIVSPWVKPMPDRTRHEHSSIVRIVREHLLDDDIQLTARDGNAAALPREIFTEHARQDTPDRLPRPAMPRRPPKDRAAKRRKVNDLHYHLMQLAHALQDGQADSADRAYTPGPIEIIKTAVPTTEAEGRRYVEEAMRQRERME